MLHKDQLHQYQLRMVEHITSRPASALWSSVGTGKTITTLTAIEELMDTCEVYGTLVVATKRIVQAVWKQEAASWYHTEGFTFSTILGSPKQRVAALFKRADIYLINYENLPWLIDKLKQHWLHKGKHLPFNLVVFDEISKMSNSKSIRTKAFCKILPYTTMRVGLTGTPATNGLVKLHGQYLVLDGGTRLGVRRADFELKYFEADYMGYKLTPRPGADEAIRHTIQDMTYTVEAKDYLELPACTVQDVLIPWSDKSRKQYDDLETEFYMEMDEGSIEVFNQAAKTMKMLQACNGFVYTDEFRNVASIHSDKLDALDELVEGLNGAPLLVCYSFKADAAAIKERFPNAVNVTDGDASDIVEKWNAGEIGMLIGHPASMGHGLNLQKGGHHLAWYGLTWDLEYYEQAVGRLDRQGQTKPVFVHRLLMEDCIEQVVSEALGNKGNTQEAIKNAVKKHQR